MRNGRGSKQVIFISWAMVVLWMMLIFFLSGQPAVESASLSGDFTQVLVAFVDKYMPSLGLNVDTFEHLLRKVAHVFVYLVLGLLVSHAFYRTGFKNKTNIMNTAVFCLFYAATDELHQLLVPGRGPSVADIVIDWGGTYLGIFLFWFILLVHAHFAGRKAWDDLVGD